MSRCENEREREGELLLLLFFFSFATVLQSCISSAGGEKKGSWMFFCSKNEIGMTEKGSHCFGVFASGFRKHENEMLFAKLIFLKQYFEQFLSSSIKSL